MISRLFSRRRYSNKRIHNKDEIFPDEVLIDSHNLPEFDKTQLAGRLERPIKKLNINLVFASFLLIVVIFSVKLWHLEIKNGADFAEKSKNNRLREEIVFAERGTVLDRNKVPLIWNEPRQDNPIPKRRYIDKDGFGHLLGYVSYPKKDSAGFYYQDSFHGVDGVEEYLADRLSGENGVKLIETNARGVVQSESTERQPKDGDMIDLSIDYRIQNELYREIESLAKKVNFQGGAAAMMDVESGEVVALTSFPDFSSNDLTEGNSKVVDALNSDSRKPFLDRAVSGLYAPGSIVKPIVALGALNENVISPEKQILSTGQIEVPNPYNPKEKTIFKDWQAQGYVDMRKAIAMSSDVYFYEVGGGFEDQKGLGITNLEKYFRTFGLGDTTGIGLEGEKKGTIPNALWKAKNFPDDKVWRLGDTYHTAIGQYGVQVTPLQMVRAIAAVANGGKLLTPTILKDESDGARYKTINIDQANFQIVKEGMRDSVRYGTAKGLYNTYTTIAAKTGTAQIGLHNENVNSWVVGFFPYEKPKYAFVVMMEKGPLHNALGGTYVMRQTLDWMNVNTPEYFGREPKKTENKKNIDTGVATSSASVTDTDVPEIAH